jgi:hypothetical protein
MRTGLTTLAGLVALGGCAFEMPDFLGREGAGASSTYELGGADPLPDPVPVPLRSAELERALHGVILRVEGVAPRQGYYGAELLPLGGGAPDAAGVVSYQLLAVPPEAPGAIGPERTRLLSAAVFVPNRALRDLRGFRVAGTGTGQTLALR